MHRCNAAIRRVDCMLDMPDDAPVDDALFVVLTESETLMLEVTEARP